MANALRFRNPKLPRQDGELARLKVVQGADYGSVFVFTGPVAVVGRGEESDVMIADLKASRRHAEFRFDGANWSVVDLGSANGIFINGKQVPTAKLRTGDAVTLGESTFEFVTSNVGTQMLVAPPRSAGEVQAGLSVMEKHREKVRALANPASLGQLAAPGQRSSGLAEDPAAKKRKLVLVAVAVGAAFMLFGGNDQKPHGKKLAAKKSPAEIADAQGGRDLAALLPETPPPPAAEMFFKSGFREYREGNYLRARADFENALMVAPDDHLAKLYLENSKKAIEDEVKILLERAKKNEEAGQLNFARAHYQSILRLLDSDRANPAYSTAQELLAKVDKEIHGEGTF